MEEDFDLRLSAGIPFSQIAGSRTSVYCGSFTNDYGKLIDRDMASYPTYTVTGTPFCHAGLVEQALTLPKEPVKQSCPIVSPTSMTSMERA